MAMVGKNGINEADATDITKKAQDWRDGGHHVFVYASARINEYKLATQIEAVERAGWRFDQSLPARQVAGTSVTLYLVFRAA
jgi:hypothetical protein